MDETLDDLIMHKLRTTGTCSGQTLADRLAANESDVLAALNRLKAGGLLRLHFTAMPVRIDILSPGCPERESDS